MLATALEIVAEKLVDILGNKAAKLTERDKTRASSYKAYYALRRIEETFDKIHVELEGKAERRSSEVPEAEAKGESDRLIVGTIRRLAPEYRILADQLGELRAAYSDMEGKFELYGSIDHAQSLRLYMGADDDVLRALFNYGEMPEDVRDISSNMAKASRDARNSVASFIRQNYDIGDSEDGT